MGVAALLAIAGFRVAHAQDRTEALYQQAKEAQSRGDLKGAESNYEEILRLDPSIAAAFNNLGALYFQDHKYDRAAAVLTKGLQRDPSMLSASALLGISLYEMGDLDHARTSLQRVLKAQPADRDVRLFLVKTLIKQNDWDDAATNLQTLAKADSRNQEVWYLLAKVHMALSEQALARMNAVDPDSVLSHQLSAEVMESMNNYEGAIVELKKAVALEPNRLESHYKLGDALYTTSQWDGAVQQFRAELALNPGNCQAKAKLGSVLLQTESDGTESLKLLNDALAACPSLAAAPLDRARALIKLNQPDTAMVDLNAALKTAPEDPSVHFLLAKVYRQQGNATKANAEMELFRRLDEAERASTAEHAAEVINSRGNGH